MKAWCSWRPFDSFSIDLDRTMCAWSTFLWFQSVSQMLRWLGMRVSISHFSFGDSVGSTGEPKSKPTQHGIRELRAVGLHPDLVVCRSSAPLEREIINKISLSCMVPPTHVVGIHDVSNIYRVPILMHERRIPALILSHLRFNKMMPEDIPRWREIARKVSGALTLP